MTEVSNTSFATLKLSSDTLLVPPQRSTLRKNSLRNDKIEPWKIHLLQLVNEVPKAIAVLYHNSTSSNTESQDNGYSRISSSPSSSNNGSLRTLRGQTESPFDNNFDNEDNDENNGEWKDSLIFTEPTFSHSLPCLREETKESRVRSLRLDIGDLSIPDNLEKLCNHYFQLEKASVEKEIVEGSSSPVKSKSSHSYDDPPATAAAGSKTSSTLGNSQSIHGHLSRTKTSSSNISNSSKVSSSGSLSVPGFGSAFHGFLSKPQTRKLLKEEGHYLIRQMQNEDSNILSIRFEDDILNYRVYFDEGDNEKEAAEGNINTSCGFFLEDRKKKYGSLDELVQDGLTTLLLELRAGSYLDMMTELAQIDKQDSGLKLVRPGSLKISGSRKNSGTPLLALSSTNNSEGQDDILRKFSIALVGLPGIIRQVSEIHTLQHDRLSKAISDFSACEEDSREMELSQHWFLEVKLEKKAKCGSPICTKNSRTIKLSKRALMCKDCRVSVHEQCLVRVLSDPQKDDCSKCCPRLDKILPIFGADLTTLVKASRCNNSSKDAGTVCPYKPPFVLVKCIEEIEKRGLQSEGLYRVSGYQDMISEIQRSFEIKNISIDMGKYQDINSICGVVKLFLRMLPQPLITSEVFASFAYENEGFITLELVKKHVKMLPAAHRITLKYLLDHLYRVTKEREVNKMSAFNLSSVLAPSMIVPQEISLNILKLGTDIVEIMIKNTHSLFSGIPK